jgi:hypothetical protein
MSKKKIMEKAAEIELLVNELRYLIAKDPWDAMKEVQMEAEALAHLEPLGEMSDEEEAKAENQRQDFDA